MTPCRAQLHTEPQIAEGSVYERLLDHTSFGTHKRYFNEEGQGLGKILPDDQVAVLMSIFSSETPTY